MADDTPDQPENDAGGDAAPAPRRRTAARKTPAKAPRQPKPKGVVTRAEEAVSRAATATRDAVVDAEERVVRAVKPRSTKRATPKRTGKQATTDAPAKRQAAKGRRGGDKSTVQRATEAVGGRWGTAALASVAAAGVTAALMSLRGSSGRDLGTPRKPIDISGSGDKGPGHPIDVHASAHQPDGTDSSASFQAGIADESTIPDAV